MEAYIIMAVTTTIPKYDKGQLLFIDDVEIRLIDHLKDLRIKNKITKKKISNLVKHNDYWYSQIERNGKNGDDNRQRSIYRTDLIKVISIVKFNASTSTEIDAYENKSEAYIDKIIKAVPLKESAKRLELYQFPSGRTKEQQERILHSLIATQAKLLNRAFESLDRIQDRDYFINCLTNFNTCLKIDPVFIIHFMGLPYMDFLYEAKQADLSNFFNSVNSLIDRFLMDSNVDVPRFMSEFYPILEDTAKKFTGGKGLSDTDTSR